MKLLFLVGVALISCTDHGSKQKEPLITDSLDSESSIIHLKTEETSAPDEFELKAVTYKTDTSGRDSTLMCTQYNFEDYSKSKEGKCYFHLPFEIDAMPTSFLERLKSEKSIETFDPLMCEVGGQSAYNKYIYKKTGSHSSEILHYKAWNEDYDEAGEPITNEVPEYFLGERLKIIDTDSYLKIEAFDDENNPLDYIENFYNEKGQCIRQIWKTYGSEVYLAHYSYPN